MAKRDSSGPPKGRRGASRSGSSTGKGRSTGKPASGKPRFTSSGPKRTDDSSFEGKKKFNKGGASSFRKDDRRPPSRDESGESKRPAFGKSAPRSTRPYPKREEGSEPRKRFSSSRDESGESKRPSYGKGAPRSRPYPKREEGSEPRKRFTSSRDESGESKRPAFGKSAPRSTRPYPKREEGSEPEKRFSSSRDESGESKRPAFGKSAPRSRPYPAKEDGDDRRKRFSEKRDESDEGKRPPYGKSAPRSSQEEGGDRKKKFTKTGTGSFSPKPRQRDEDGEPKGRGFFNKDSFKSRPRRYTSKKQEAPTIANQTGKIRLNRYIANSGVCSRREADELIKMGLVTVNGNVITEMGFQVSPRDEVRYENRLLRAEKPVYILMNKPKGYLTTTKDPQERNTVMHIIGNAVKERVYPVGRLDRNTTGLLMFTNDGELADKLMHPSNNVKKIYKVELDRALTKNDFQKIVDGIQLEEGRAMVDDLAIVSDDNKTVGIEIHIGWNRVVRRIFERLEYEVVKLDRTVYAGLDKKDLPRGHFRYLTEEEIIRLKHYK